MKSFPKPTILGLTFGLLLAGYAVFAFQSPTQAPPAGNQPAPINTGSVDQIKQGGLLTVFGLWVNQALGVSGGGTFGGIVNLQGNKIINVGSPSAAGDVATKGYTDSATAGLQARVSGSCPGGQGIRAVGADGSVTCESPVSRNLQQGPSYESPYNSYDSIWRFMTSFSVPASAIQWMTDFTVDTRTSANRYCNSGGVRLVCNGNTLWSSGYGANVIRYERLGVYQKDASAGVECMFQAQSDPICNSGFQARVLGYSPYME